VETDFKIKVGEFEGPLDILLDLIERRKLHISDVSLSKVADDFIEHTKNHYDFPMMDSADFILIASTLLLIKSKSLLPNLAISDIEQASIVDLEERLGLYKKYKDLSLNIQKMFGRFLFFPSEKKQTLRIFSPTEEISILKIRSALSNIIQNLPTKAILPKVTMKKVISLEEMVDRLTDRIQRAIKTSFKEFSGIGRAEKIGVIVSFLAMLELVKQGVVRVNQTNHFDDIEIESENIGTPIY
jgi:segregation and condensation protein A